MRRRRAGSADVVIAETAAAGGALVAGLVADRLRAAVERRAHASMVLATGNSQLSLFAALRERDDVPWSRTTIFHMDEYVGLDAEHPASFRAFLRRHLVDAVSPMRFEGIAGDAADIAAEIRRYDRRLGLAPPDVCVMGIGENGHLAFNEPPANFDTTERIRVVELAEASRRQQVSEGHFASLNDVPTSAISLTIPMLLVAPAIFVVVPERRKATAVAAALAGPIMPSMPASILQATPGVLVVLDAASAELLP